jgi:NTE family protein
VLEVLEEHGLRPHVVAGTSAGAVIGAAYAAGMHPRQMRDRARRVRWADLSEPVLPRRSLLGTKRLQAFLDDVLQGKTFDQLQLPFACGTADILTGEEVWLHRPDLRVSQAVRASCAIPGIFPPVRLGGRLLVDGGLFGTVPVRGARILGADLVVAVQVAGMPFRGREPQTVVATVMAALSIMQRARELDELTGADLVIAPRTEEFSLVDLSAVDGLAEAGREATLAMLPALRELWATAAGGQTA